MEVLAQADRSDGHAVIQGKALGRNIRALSRVLETVHGRVSQFVRLGKPIVDDFRRHVANGRSGILGT